ncbi:uncharacterized protein LOC100183382 [Ciona intestinalis]
MRSTNMQKHHIMLTGFPETEKSLLIKIIKDLGGSYCCDQTDSEKFLPICTHVVAKKPCRSQKFLCACASGKWLVVDKYLLDSQSAKKFLPELKYEWGNIYKYDRLPEDVQQAPSRWRQALKKDKNKLPFSGWVVGLCVAKSFPVYKRLLEIGGGKAINLKQTKQKDFTHILVGKTIDSKVESYRKTGVPCLKCEYLAQYLLHDPPPPLTEYSVFPNDISVKNDPISLALVGDALRQPKVVITRLALHENSNNNNNEKKGSTSHNVDTAAAGSSVTNDTPPRHEPSLQRNIQHTSHGEPEARAGSLATQNATERSEDELSKVKPQLSTESDSSTSTFTSHEVKDSSPAVFLNNNEASSSNFQTSGSEDKDRFYPVHSATHFYKSSSTSSDDRPGPGDVDATHLAIPDSIRNARALFRKTLAKLRPNCSTSIGIDVLDSTHNISHYDVTSAVRPCRFGRREMATVEGFVEVNHGRSVLRMCRSLLSASSYPPPDLLYLLMNKYLLDTDKKYESELALSFLNTVTSLHPPNAPHIRHDDVYLQAMGVSRSTESSLLSAAGLQLGKDFVLWNQERTPESQQWIFVDSILKQAADDNDMLRRHNAAELFTIVTSWLGYDQKLLRHLFWTKSNKYQLTSAIRRLMEWLRISMEKGVEFTENEEKKNTEVVPPNDVSKDDVAADDVSESESEPDENDQVSHAHEVWTSLLRSLTQTTLAVAAWLREHDQQNFDHIVVKALFEQFNDVKLSVLDRMLGEFPSTITLQLTRTMLEKSCWKNLSRIRSKGGFLSLHRIVNRYFRFLPKLPRSLMGDLIRNKRLSSTGDGTANPDASKGEATPMANQVNDQPHHDTYVIDVNLKLSSATVNKRNSKGETPLHHACMHDRPDHVTKILGIPGVDPNSRDNAGWTPISEACNRGHVGCVQELLKLPLSSMSTSSKMTSSEHTSPGATSSAQTPTIEKRRETPRLEIDLLSCPDEGTTPLHDALMNGHTEVAEILLRKGGTQLLDAKNKDGKSALDVCQSEDTLRSFLIIACSLASEQCSIDVAMATKQEDSSSVKIDAKDDDYAKILPPPLMMGSPAWIGTCDRYVILLRHLLHAYVTETSLVPFLCLLGTREEPENDEPPDRMDEFDCDVQSPLFEDNEPAKESSNDVSDTRLLRYEQDMTYILKWRHEKWLFGQHLRKIVDVDKLTVDYKFHVFQGPVIDDLKAMFQ